MTPHFTGTYTYKSRDVCALAGVASRQLTYWMERGVVAPDQFAYGRGDQHLFSRRGVMQVAIVRRLVEAGVKLDKVTGVLGKLESRGYFERLHHKSRLGEPVALVAVDDGDVQIEVEVDPTKLMNGHMVLVHVNLKTLEVQTLAALLDWERQHGSERFGKEAER